jgi:F420-dependent oxidoreductase-like protein
VTIRLGYSIPRFTFGTPVSELFPTVIAQAREAEAAGFDCVTVMDHFYQLPILGKPDEPMLECYTTLGALATATETIQVSALVTGNTYRNPALLAKTVTTLDVVSGGRAVLGVGTGWYELEHSQLGFEFGTFTERFERLEEALQIVIPMMHGERPTFSGKWYHVENAVNEPRYRDHIPVLLGGSGEKKTFGMAARFADHLNIVAPLSELPRKMDALKQRCAEVDRDPATLETSALITVRVSDGGKSDVSDAMADRAVIGSPQQIADIVQRKVIAAGVDGVVLNVGSQGQEPGIITQVGQALKPLFSA